MNLIQKAFFGNHVSKAVGRVDFNSLIQNTPVVFYNFDKHDFIEKGYTHNAEVYKIVRKIIDKLQVADPYVYIEKNNNYTKYKKHRYSNLPTEHIKKSLYVAKSLDYADSNSDLVRLLEKPNDTQTFSELRELMDIFYFVQGECFVVRETELNSDIPTAIKVVPSNHVQHIYDHRENKIVGWVVNWGKGLTQSFEVEDVFHLKMANPFYDVNGEHLRGMSPLLAGLKYLQLDDVSIEAWVKSMQNEGAKGIVSPNHADPKLWLDKAQVEATNKNIQEKIHGFENRNKIAVSGMPLQYTQIGMSPDALNIIEGMREAQINLCDLWGVPSVLFDSNPTYQNQKEASKRFLGEVILPYLDKQEDKLNRWLVEPFRKRDGKNYVIDYDTSTYDELKPSLDDMKALSEILTKNEMRIIQGYDTLETEAADLLYINSGQVPINDFEV